MFGCSTLPYLSGCAWVLVTGHACHWCGGHGVAGMSWSSALKRAGRELTTSEICTNAHEGIGYKPQQYSQTSGSLALAHASLQTCQPAAYIISHADELVTECTESNMYKDTCHQQALRAHSELAKSLLTIHASGATRGSSHLITVNVNSALEYTLPENAAT